MPSLKRDRRLNRDLDNIVLKALRKEPARRYSSAEQLADDIQRHLQGLPVAATPASASYRVSKFVRRHKMGVTATALITLAVAGGAAATLREARVAVTQRARAERRFNDVRKLANSFLFEFDDAIRNLPGSTPARSLVVKRASEYLDSLAEEAHGDRSLQLEIALAYQRVGEVQGDPMFPNLGDSKGALESSRKALAILETLHRVEPENQQVGLALASTHQTISDVLHFSGDIAGTMEHSAEALKIYESLAGSMANDLKFQIDRVEQTYNDADLRRLAGRLGESEAEYRRAVELSEQMVAAYLSDPVGKIHLATSFDGLGNLLQEIGDTASAIENRRKGLAIREELVRLNPNDAHYRRQLAFSHHNVGLSLMEAGDLAAALTNFRTELALFESLSAADPKDVQGRRNRSLAHKQIGDVLMRTGQVHGALAEYRAALDIDRDLISVDPVNWQAALDLSFSEVKVGSTLGKLGHTRDGLAMLHRGIQRQEVLLVTDSHHVQLYSHLAGSYTLLAHCLRESRDNKSAIEYFRKAVAARLTLADKNPNSSLNRASLAECYTSLAQALAPIDGNDALKQYGNAFEVLEHLSTAYPGNAHYRTALADAMSNAARLYVRLASKEPALRIQHWTKAKSLYQRSQQLWFELERAGKVPPGRNGAVPEVSAELARCNDFLAKLEQPHEALK